MRLKKFIASRLMVFFVQAIQGQRIEYFRMHLVRGLWLPVDNSISVNVFFVFSLFLFFFVFFQLLAIRVLT